MEIRNLQDVQRRPRNIAVGTFDGVHLGHQAVIRDAQTVLTFDPHPISVVHPSATPKLLTTTEQKADLIAKLGIKELVVITFDQQFSKLDPQEFIDLVL